MSSPAAAKARGRETERMVVAYLVQCGWPHAERRRLRGALDAGDVTGIPGVCVEIKGDRSNKISKWREETLIEAANANADFPLLVVRKERKPIQEWEAHVPIRVVCEDVSHYPAWEGIWIRMDLRDAVIVMRDQGF